MDSRLNEMMDRRDSLVVILANYNAMVSLCEENQKALSHLKGLNPEDRKILNRDFLRMSTHLKEGVENIADMIRDNNSSIRKLFEEKKEE